MGDVPAAVAEGAPLGRHSPQGEAGSSTGTTAAFATTDHPLPTSILSAHRRQCNLGLNGAICVVGVLADGAKRWATVASAAAADAAPFFLYVAYTAPHSPYRGPDDRRPKPLSQEEWNQGDPAEKHDLLADRPGEAQRLKALLAEWETRVQHTRGMA